MLKNGDSCYFHRSLMVLNHGTDGLMDGQTPPFHHKTNNRRQKSSKNARPLFFVYASLMCTCAQLLSQTGELPLLPSLHTVSKWTFIRNGSCLWEWAQCCTHTNWQILHCILHSNWCQLLQTQPAAVWTVSNLWLQSTVKHSEEKREGDRLAILSCTSTIVQQFKVLVFVEQVIGRLSLFTL